LRVLKGFSLSFSIKVPGVRRGPLAWWPLLAGRASCISRLHRPVPRQPAVTGAVLGGTVFRQMFTCLPIGLFGVSGGGSESPGALAPAGRGSGGDAACVRRACAIVPSSTCRLCSATSPRDLVIAPTGAVSSARWGPTGCVYPRALRRLRRASSSTTPRPPSAAEHSSHSLGDLLARPPAIGGMRVLVLRFLMACPLMYLVDRVPLSALDGAASWRPSLSWLGGTCSLPRVSALG